MGFIGFVIVGLIAGLIARLVVPGGDSMGILATIALGMVGSFVGGTLGSVLQGDGWDFTSAGIIGSIIGAIIALLAFQWFSGRSKA